MHQQMTAPETAPQIRRVGWDEIHRASMLLAAKVEGLGPWVGIVAVTRGGMVPATLVARLLDIRLIETLCVESYVGRTAATPRVLKAPPGDGAGWLVIDDLVDSGQTARVAQRMLPRAHVACLYAKPGGRPYAHSFIEAVDQDVWIEFPWEVDPD